MEFGLRTGTKDFKTGFYKGTDRAKTGTMVEDRPTRPFVDALVWMKEKLYWKNNGAIEIFKKKMYGKEVSLDRV